MCPHTRRDMTSGENEPRWTHADTAADLWLVLQEGGRSGGRVGGKRRSGHMEVRKRG